MDSLLANYASSDEEGNEDQPPPQQQRIPPARTANSKSGASPPNPTAKRGGIFNSLPPPKSSLFNSLPPPKPQSGYAQQRDVNVRDEQIVDKPTPKPSSSSSSSLFNSLPPPKSSSSSSSSASKKVVQFRPPTITNPYNGNFDDEDDDVDEGELERQRKRAKESISTSSAASFLSSIPAPRYSNTLGTMSSASGTNRRSIIETDAPSSAPNKISTSVNDAVVNPNVEYLKDQSNETNYDYSANESYAYYSGNVGLGESSSVELGSDAGVNYDANQAHEVYYDNSGGESYYGDVAQYGNNWANGYVLPGVSAVAEEALRVPGRRGRKDTPIQIVEVKQDELMKNRPRQDQVKSTGIAFGPQYQPASTKGKPTKLHKRKHQIGSLLFDMRQKEMELAERRSKGFLTKAQTQAKYGW